MKCNLMINTAPSVDNTSNPVRAASAGAVSKPAEGKNAFHKQLQKVQPKQEGDGQQPKNRTRAVEETVDESVDTAAEQEGDTACAAMLQGVDGLCQALLAAVEEFQAAVGEESADQNPSSQVESYKTTVSMSDESSEAIVQALVTLVQTLEEAVTSTDDAADQTQTTAASSTTAMAEADSTVDTENQQELPGKIMLMLHQNKNHLSVKLKIQDHNGMNQAAQDAPQENAPGQVKKLMDFESQRLSAAKLSTDVSSGQTTTETGDEAGTQSEGEPGDTAPTFTLISRETPGVTRLTIRESVAQTSLPKTEEVFDQIVDQARVMLKANSSEMQIELKPDFLGKMTIKIMVEDGMVTAKFVTDNQQVKQMLESNLANLRQTLENNGLKVDRTEVNVEVGNNWLAGSSTGQQPSWESGSGYQNTGYTEDARDDGLNAAWLEETAGTAASAYTGLEEGQMSIVI